MFLLRSRVPFACVSHPRFFFTRFSTGGHEAKKWAAEGNAAGNPADAEAAAAAAATTTTAAPLPFYKKPWFRFLVFRVLLRVGVLALLWYLSRFVPW